MKVAHVITRLIVGGAQENTISTVLGLRQKPGCEVSLVSGPSPGREGSLEPEVRSAGLHLQIIQSLVRPVQPIKDWFAYQNLFRLFQAHKPDIVHTHSGKAGFLGRLAAARAAVPVIIHTIHGPSFGPWQGFAANKLFAAAERRAARVTSHFVSVADAMSAQYLRAGIGSADQFSTIRSGFDLDPFLAARNDPAFRRHLGLAPDDIVVGKIARLFKLKGHDDLLDIAPGLLREEPRLKFLCVGDGPWRSRLEKRARDLGVAPGFRFVGLVPPASVARYIGVMDFLVHLSYREGLPRALPQALAASRPVVAYDADGAAEVCLNRQTGLLVSPGNRPELMRSILELAGSPDLRARFGLAGRHLVQAQFPSQKMVDDIFSLYQEQLARCNGLDARRTSPGHARRTSP